MDIGGGSHIGPVGDEVLGLARARQLELESNRQTRQSGQRPSGALALRVLVVVLVLIVLAGWVLTAINTTTF